MHETAWRRALLTVRTFMGIVYLTNGTAKLFGFSHFDIGPWHTYLIDRDGARGNLQGSTANPAHGIGVVNDLVHNVLLPNWGWMQWLVTFGEIAVGLGLLFGILGRFAALGGFLMAFPLFITSLGGGGWAYDYLFEPVLLLMLFFVRDLPGLDSWFMRWLSRPSVSSRTSRAAAP